jgi:DNA-3-methyladenine glycosylase II
MVSSKAAAAIHSRLLAHHGSAEEVFRWAASGPAPKGPGGGLTRIKRKTLRAWWKYCEEGSVDPASDWKKLTREDLRKTVSGLYGLGPWTADILGIFLIGRLDIWPIGDTGLRRARAAVFGRLNDRRFFKRISGYESLVAVYLWELLNRNLEGHFLAP